jgi:hypothetical protein
MSDGAADDQAATTADGRQDPFADPDRALDAAPHERTRDMSNGSADRIPDDTQVALEALKLSWADEYDDIWFTPGAGWVTHHKDAAEDDILIAGTAGELNLIIRADWQNRHDQS